MQILLIEPDRVLAGTYQQALASLGDIFVATNGQEAIEMIDRIGHVDAIVLELQLPGLNGIAFLQELRSYTDTQRTPVIIQTYMQTPLVAEMDIIREAFDVKQWLYKPRTSLKNLREAVLAHLVGA